MSSADSLVIAIGRFPCRSHRHRRIIIYGLSHVQPLLLRQPSSSATHRVDKTPPSYPASLYSTKHGHVPKNGVNNYIEILTHRAILYHLEDSRSHGNEREGERARGQGACPPPYGARPGVSTNQSQLRGSCSTDLKDQG